MARRVFISFLGYSNYGYCKYQKENFISDNVRFIQTATLDYLQSLEKWNENDVAYFLLTKGAKERNWVDNGHSQVATPQDGLATCLRKKNYPFSVQPVENLPDGKNEEEIFDIFKTVYAVLEPNDILYFDITHGFRSLPMLALVLVNYAKFLKHVEVRSITYGNYEVRTKVTDECVSPPVYVAPIIDLLPLSQIQDWTFATADFLKNGNADKFEELAKAYQRSIFTGHRSGDTKEALALSGLVIKLKEVIDDFQTCRGVDILHATHIAKLQKNVETIGETVIEPLNPVLKKIENAFNVFDTSANSRNGFEAARWCMAHNLYQQAATILQETTVSFFCEKHQLNICDEKERMNVNIAFAFLKKLKADNTSEEELEYIKQKMDQSPLLQHLMADPLLSRTPVVNAFGLLTDERNDINHNGMRPNPHTANDIRKNINKAFDSLYAEFDEEMPSKNS